MANLNVEWTKVLINPLGLIGYTLFLVFGLIARIKHKTERRWILLTAVVAAWMALIGGLFLAYKDVTRQNQQALSRSPDPAPVPAALPQQVNGQSQSETSGAQSPIIVGNQGTSVSVNYNASPALEKKKISDKKIQKGNAQ